MLDQTVWNRQKSDRAFSSIDSNQNNIDVLENNLQKNNVQSSLLKKKKRFAKLVIIISILIALIILITSIVVPFIWINNDTLSSTTAITTTSIVEETVTMTTTIETSFQYVYTTQIVSTTTTTKSDCHVSFSTKLFPLSTFNITSKAYIGDINNDGINEIFGVNNMEALFILKISDGTLKFHEFYQDFKKIREGGCQLEDIERSSCLIISDINDDGKPDIITSNFNGGKLSILLNTGDQLYLPPSFYTIAAPTFMTLADVNNDGKVDIICKQFDFGEMLSIIINLGGGIFSAPIQKNLLHQRIPTWTSIDINGDGKIDILSPYENVIRILINMGNGSFYQSFNYLTTSQIAYIAGADLNNDKYNDIIISYTQENKISIVINNGNGDFKYPISYSPLIDFFPTYITTFDLNNDQKLDIILTNRNIPNIVIFYNIGHGNFAFHTTYSTRQPASYVAPIHINNDNIIDFIYLTNNGIGIISTECY